MIDRFSVFQQNNSSYTVFRYEYVALKPCTSINGTLYETELVVMDII